MPLAIQAAGFLQVSASAVPLPSTGTEWPLEARVQTVADGVTERAAWALAAKRPLEDAPQM